MTTIDAAMSSNPQNTNALDLSRYSRQSLLPEIGEDGQRALIASRVVLIGCGALGSALADTLVRAGVGTLRIVDRDFVELNNLQRQVLFDENDVASGLPKAEAAARKLRAINSSVTIEPVIADANHRNIEQLCEGADLLLDGTDNFETRYLINDLAVQSQRPWVYGAVIGATGLCMAVLPGETPCLRCVFEEAPPPEVSPTCDTAGVLGPVVQLVAGFQAIEAIKVLTGRRDEVTRKLISIDGWSTRVMGINVSGARENGGCPCCGQKQFEYLEGKVGSSATTLCGRNAVQIRRSDDLSVSLEHLAMKLAPLADAPPKHNAFLLRAQIGAYTLAVFADGRAIIQGTEDVEEARSVYAKYIGS